MKIITFLTTLICVFVTTSFGIDRDKLFGGDAKGLIVNRQGSKREVEIDTDCIWKSKSEAKKHLFFTMKQVILQDERVAKIHYNILECPK